MQDGWRRRASHAPTRSAARPRRRAGLSVSVRVIAAPGQEECMALRNSDKTWGWPAKVLHWIGAVIILLLLGHGWWMTHMAPRPDRLAHYAGHSALGYDFMVLLVLRLLWRWMNPVPELPSELKRWERISARVGHVSLYVLMLVVSITGWMVAPTFRTPITKDIFGIDVPAIVTTVSRPVRQAI